VRSGRSGAKTLADFRVDHGAVLERLLVDSFTALVRAGVASLDRVAQDEVRVRASAGAASFRRYSTLKECQRAAEKAVHDPRTQLDADPGAASRMQVAARRRAADPSTSRIVGCTVPSSHSCSFGNRRINASTDNPARSRAQRKSGGFTSDPRGCRHRQPLTDSVHD